MTALPDIRFDFVQSAQRAMRDYPALQQSAAFFDPAHGAVYNNSFFKKSFSDQMADRLRRIFSPKDRLNKRNLAKSIKRIGPHMLPVGHAEDVLIQLMCFSGTAVTSFLENLTTVLQDYDRDARMSHLIFSHELGHMVLGVPPDAQPIRYQNKLQQEIVFDPPASEILADTFSAYTEIASGRADQQLLDDWSLERAIRALSSDIPHYTSPALDAIVQMDKTGIAELSPKLIEAVARKHAEIFSPCAGELERLHRDFSSSFEEMRNLTPQTAYLLRGIAEKTVACAANPLTLYTGARILAPFMQKGGKMTRHGNIALEGEFWKKAATNISNALRTIPEGHFLRLLDLNKVDVLEMQKPPAQKITVRTILSVAATDASPPTL